MSGAPVGLLDTSAVISLGRVQGAADLPDLLLISAITLAELSVGPLVARTDAERRARQAVLQQVESGFSPVPFADACARSFGSVAASPRSRGRKPAARAYDALIAATALAHHLPLYTCNAEDFDGIDGLTVAVLTTPD